MSANVRLLYPIYTHKAVKTNTHKQWMSVHTHQPGGSAFHQGWLEPAGSFLTVYNPLSEQMDALPKRSVRAKHGEKT